MEAVGVREAPIASSDIPLDVDLDQDMMDFDAYVAQIASSNIPPGDDQDIIASDAIPSPRADIAPIVEGGIQTEPQETDAHGAPSNSYNLHENEAVDENPRQEDLDLPPLDEGSIFQIVDDVFGSGPA